MKIKPPQKRPLNLTAPKTLRGAIRKKNISSIVNFLNNNVDPNKKVNYMENTALHLAVNLRRYEIVEILLHYAADIHATNIKGFTPLHVAAQKNDPQMIEILLKNNASILLEDNSGNTAGQLAAKLGHYSAANLLHPSFQPIVSKNRFPFFSKPEEIVVEVDPSDIIGLKAT